jgi:hypothetical protein
MNQPRAQRRLAAILAADVVGQITPTEAKNVSLPTR